jgi:hypothetical protein
MPQPTVFACPSCGSSISAAGDALVKCMFCGQTVAVPGAPAAQTAAAPAPDAPLSTPYLDRAGQPAVLNSADFRVIADAVRAGDRATSEAEYQRQFRASPDDARQAIDTLAASGLVSIGTTPEGGPCSSPWPELLQPK